MYALIEELTPEELTDVVGVDWRRAEEEIERTEFAQEVRAGLEQLLVAGRAA